MTAPTERGSAPTTVPDGGVQPADSGPDLDPDLDLDLDELTRLTVELAERAGEVIVELRADAVATTTTKSSPTDPVTEADRAAERLIVDGIRRARPDDTIIGEEGADHVGTSGLAWHIDPIDGTTNYVYGLPAYGVSVAVGAGDRMLAGAVANPMAGELFAATLGRGATLNDEPIAVAGPVELPAALVATGFGYQAERRRAQAAVVAALLPEIRDIRRMGSAALDLCAVACGRVDAYYELGLNRWDFASGVLIATEAGARCSDLAGGPPSTDFLVAASPDLHGPLTRRLVELGA
ncbi:MAG: inositol monophosphatase family protein [Actinomycetota bacterium]